MPRSTVSTAIAELEARLGARLLNRTTRTVMPTDEGERLYDRCQTFLHDSEGIETMFRSAAGHVEGRIRVDLPGRRIASLFADRSREQARKEIDVLLQRQVFFGNGVDDGHGGVPYRMNNRLILSKNRSRL